MTSYGSTGSISYTLSKRHLPRSQTEAIPTPDDFETSEDESPSYTPSSIRANFLPPGADFGIPDQATIDRYGSFRSESPFFSPVFAHLPYVHPERLQVASEEAQMLRRKLMRGSNMLIVQGGYIGKRFVYDRLKELEVSVTILDGPNSVWREAAEEGVIADFIELDFTEHSTIFQRAMDAIADAVDVIKFDAVTTYYEDAVPLAARIATALGIAVNSVDACDKARNKRRTREVMAEFGLPAPKFMPVYAEKDVVPACNHVGFPAILKPIFGAASMGVTRVNTIEEAVEVYRKSLLTFSIDDDTIWAQGTEMVLEEYYDGDEFDIDLLISDGIVVYAKVSDNWACREPWFQETGTNCPSFYPEAKQRELTKLAIDSTLALGFKYGCFHVECKYTSRGPRLIEINARMGGVAVRDANLIAWGVDLVEEHAMCALKIPIRPLLPEKPLGYMAETVFNAPYSGTLNADRWLDFALKDPRVHKISYFKVKGDKVIGPKDGVPDWLVELIVISRKSQKDALDLMRDIVEKKAPVPITPKVGEEIVPYFFPGNMHPFKLQQHDKSSAGAAEN